MSHAHDLRERFVTDHPGSKRGKVKAKNRTKWGRRKRALRKREQLAALVAARGSQGQGGMVDS